MDTFGALVTVQNNMMLGMFSMDTEKVQLILVQFFAADVGPGFLLIPVIVGLAADWSSQNSLCCWCPI